jgi:hypothetical protein
MWLKIKISLPHLRGIGRHDRAEKGTAEREVLAEAQTLLAGRAAEMYAAGRSVPFWAWLNALAHCTPESLGTVASGYPLHALMPRTTSFTGECATLSPAEALELQRGGPDPGGTRKPQRRSGKLPRRDHAARASALRPNAITSQEQANNAIASAVHSVVDETESLS